MFHEKTADQLINSYELNIVLLNHCCFFGPALSQRVSVRIFRAANQLADARSMMLLDGTHAGRMRKPWQLVLESSPTCSNVTQGGAKRKSLGHTGVLHVLLSFAA